MTKLLLWRSRLAQWHFSAGTVLLAMLPITVALGSLAPLNVGRLQATATDAVVLALVVLSACDAFLAVPQPLLTRAYRLLLGMLVLLVLFMALSALWATDRVAALKEILKWSEALAVVLVAPHHLRTREDIRLVLQVLVGVAVGEAMLGLAQGTVLAGMQHVSADRGVRVVGTFGQPNPYAGYLDMTLPLLLAMAAWAKSPRVRWFSIIAALVLGGALALAQSRGAEIGLAGAMVAMAWCGWPHLRRWLMGAATGSFAAVGVALLSGRLALSTFLEHLGWHSLTNAALSTQVTDANFSTLERLAHWAAAVRMVAAHPLGGVGIGNYAAAYPHYAVPRWPLALGHAHNLYLNMAAEIGMIGAFFYIAFVAVGLVLVWPPTPGKRWGDPIALGIFGAGIALVLHNLFDDMTTHSMLIQWMLLCMCAQMLPLVRLDKGSITADQA